MNKQEIINQFKQMPWAPWLHRRFSPFVTYLMMKYATPAGFKTQGINGQFPIALYDTDDWYGTEEMFRLAGEEAERYLKETNIFILTKQCEDALLYGRKALPLLYKSNADPITLLKEVLAIIDPINVYIWVAHGSEAFYRHHIRNAAKEHVQEDELDKFIGDISFPSKKNALAQLEDDIRTGLSVNELYQKYAWIKARGGFVPGYTLEEMAEIQTKVLNEKHVSRPEPKIPTDLISLAQEMQEVVYLRTLRTDSLWELYYIAQPIFDTIAKGLGLPSVKDYISDELIAGNFEVVPHEHAILKYYDEVLVVRNSIVSQSTVEGKEVAGVIAQKGNAIGTVRIIYTAADTGKVQKGDIIVTNMTTPAYITAMQRAAAFVTDEGGITCHAAILAREMRKPCVIGTKIATKIFKDGDVVEVDAIKGIVKKLN